MSFSVFGLIFRYLKEVFAGFRSILRSCLTVFPYHFGWGEKHKEVTEQYPDPVSSRTEDDLPARTRGLLFNDIDRCTGCGECQKVCPADCIQVQAENGPDPAKKWVATFNIDFSHCIFCGLCVEVCEPESLTHTKQFEGAVYFVNDMSVSFGRGVVTPEQRLKWEEIRRSRELEGF